MHTYTQHVHMVKAVLSLTSNSSCIIFKLVCQDVYFIYFPDLSTAFDAVWICKRKIIKQRAFSKQSPQLFLAVQPSAFPLTLLEKIWALPFHTLLFTLWRHLHALLINTCLSAFSNNSATSRWHTYFVHYQHHSTTPFGIRSLWSKSFLFHTSALL